MKRSLHISIRTAAIALSLLLAAVGANAHTRTDTNSYPFSYLHSNSVFSSSDPSSAPTIVAPSLTLNPFSAAPSSAFSSAASYSTSGSRYASSLSIIGAASPSDLSSSPAIRRVNGNTPLPSEPNRDPIPSGTLFLLLLLLLYLTFLLRSYHRSHIIP